VRISRQDGHGRQQGLAGLPGGKLNEIRDYCETDVVNTYLMYCRFQLMRGGLTPREFDMEVALAQETLAELPGRSGWNTCGRSDCSR
jgi:predicted PolB exonuclease-like 3'-5' exonuclease